MSLEGIATDAQYVYPTGFAKNQDKEVWIGGEPKEFVTKQPEIDDRALEIAGTAGSIIMSAETDDTA